MEDTLKSTDTGIKQPQQITVQELEKMSVSELLKKDCNLVISPLALARALDNRYMLGFVIGYTTKRNERLNDYSLHCSKIGAEE